METRAPTAGRIAVMALFALSCFGLLLYVWIAFGGAVPFKPHGYRFHVAFDEATQLSPQADVRISGVTVGKVIKLQRSLGRTDATVELQRPFAPIPSDSRAILRTKTLLGETYVQLTPGSPGARKLPEDGTLPPGQVQPTVELDEVLRSLDRRTRVQLRRFVISWAGALHGRGQDVNDALGNLPETTEQSGGVLRVLDSQRAAVSRLVRDSGTVFAAVGRRQDAVRTLISSGDRVLATTSERNRQLTDTVRILPVTLRELRATLVTAEGTAVDAAPVVRALRPAAPLLRPVLANLSALAPDAKALFGRLDPVISLSRTALPAATRTVRSLGPLLDVLYPAGRELVPVAQYLGLYKTELTTMFANVAADTQATFQEPGAREPVHYLRTLIPFTNEGFATQAQRLPSNRHNPYLRPRGLDLLPQGLESFDCENLGNPQTIPAPPLGAPPCKVQPPILFQGRRTAFPRLTLDPP